MSFRAKLLLHLYESGMLTCRDFIKKSSTLDLAGMLPAGLLSLKTQAAMPKKDGHFSAATVKGSSSETAA